MISMFLSILRVNKGVIYEHDYKLVKIRSEGPVHKINKGCGGIGEAERHYCKLIMSIPSPKYCLRDIFRFNLKLMVP